LGSLKNLFENALMLKLKTRVQHRTTTEVLSYLRRLPRGHLDPRPLGQWTSGCGPENRQ
jgi:hypothetical protein